MGALFLEPLGAGTSSGSFFTFSNNEDFACQKRHYL
jgi:hypothetical protein